MTEIKKGYIVLPVTMLMLMLCGCFPDTPVVPVPTATVTPGPTEPAEQEKMRAPSKEEVLAMRELVKEGMDRNEFDRLTEEIKAANLAMERAYLYDDLFGKLADETHEYWEQFTVTEFVGFLEEISEAVQCENFRQDLQYMIDQAQLAADTHKMEYANNLYKALHDMDYFLLRYGMEDVGIYVKEKGVLAKYYGVLKVYQSNEE